MAPSTIYTTSGVTVHLGIEGIDAKILTGNYFALKCAQNLCLLSNAHIA